VNRRDFVAGGTGEQNGSHEWEVDSAAVKQCSRTALAFLFCFEKTGTQRLQAEPIDWDRILCVWVKTKTNTEIETAGRCVGPRRREETVAQPNQTCSKAKLA
jgi:hypothetical protein